MNEAGRQEDTMHLMVEPKRESGMDRAMDGAIRLVERFMGAVTRKPGAQAGGGFAIYSGPSPAQMTRSLSDKGVDPSRMLAAFESLVFACVNVRAKEIARWASQGVFKAYSVKANGDLQELGPNHPLQQLLDMPNPYLSRWVVWYLTVVYADLTGNAYSWISRDRLRIPRALWPLPSDKVRIMPTKNVRASGRLIDGYEIDWKTGSSSAIEIVPEEDILHLKYPNPNDPYYYGMSLLMRASIEVDLDQYIVSHQRDFFKNDARPAGIITFPEVLDETVRKAFEEQWLKKFQGKPGQNAYLEGGATYTSMMNQKELDYLESAGVNRKRVQSIFGVPDSKLMIEESIQARATLETLDYNFLKETIDPLMTMIDEQLTLDLARQSFGEKIVVKHDSVIPRDRRLEIELDREALLAGTTHINEIRERDGRTPYIGGDEPLVQMGMMPLSMVGEQPDLEAPDEDPNSEENNPDESMEDPVEEASKAMIPEEVKDYVWEKHERLRMKIERRMALRVKRVVRRIQTAVEEKLKARGETRSIVKATLQSPDEVMFDLTEWVEKLARDLGMVNAMAVKEAFEAFLKQYKVDGVVYSPSHPEVVKALALLTSKTRTVVQTLHGELLMELKRGIELEEPIDKLSQRVSKFFNGTTDFRARRIAATNSNFAVNAANLTAAKQAGIFKTKVWVTQRDNRVRDIHRAMDDVEIGMSEMFTLPNNDVLEVPGDPRAVRPESVINCRCTAMFIKEKKG